MWRSVRVRSGRWRVTGAYASLFLFACASSSDGEDTASLSREAAALRTAISHVVEEYDPPVMVDPRPLGVHVAPRFPSASDYLRVDDAVVEARRRVVYSMGLNEAEIFPLLPDCSVENAPPPLKVTSGCPDEPVLRVAFGELAMVDSTWHMRGLAVWYRRTGVNVTSFELEMLNEGDHWTVVNERWLVAWT